MMRAAAIVVACLILGCNSAPEPEKQPVESRVLLKVRSIVAKLLGKSRSAIQPDSTFAALGADDLDVVEIVMETEEVFGVVIPDDVLTRAAGISNADELCSRLTVRTFASVVESAPKQPARSVQP